MANYSILTILFQLICMEPEIRKAPIRFYEIDLLRFLAAISVVLYHYTFRAYAAGNYSPIPLMPLSQITKYGFFGVQLFFIISGYVVLLSARGKTVRQFLMSRITRLYPAFWAACTLTFIVKKIWGSSSTDVQMSPFLAAAWKQYAVNMTMLQEFLGLVSIDSAYWSLTVEITFYFLVSLLIGYRLMHRLDLFIALWLLFAALPDWFRANTSFNTLFIGSYAPYFAAGMLFFLLQHEAKRTWYRYGLLLLAYLLAIRSVLGELVAKTQYYHVDFSALVAVGLVTLFFLLFLLIAFRVVSLHKHGWLVWAGALTYPLYLLHSDIAFVVFHRLYGRVSGEVLIVAMIGVMLLAAYLIHLLVEQKLNKLLGQKLQQWLAYFDTEQDADKFSRIKSRVKELA